MSGKQLASEWESRNLGVIILSVDVRALATASGQKAEQRLQSLDVRVITAVTTASDEGNDFTENGTSRRVSTK